MFSDVGGDLWNPTPTDDFLVPMTSNTTQGCDALLPGLCSFLLYDACTFVRV